MSVILIITLIGSGRSMDKFTRISWKTTWNEGEQLCLTNGRHLASIRTEESKNGVEEACHNKECWIGLTKPANEGGLYDWSWTDGSEWEGRGSYENFDQHVYGALIRGEDEGTCAYMSHSVFWMSSDGVGPHYPICGEVCEYTLTGFHWGGFNGEWKRLPDVYSGGESVFYRDCYGGRYYMWHDDCSDCGSGYWTSIYGHTSLWVIGYDYKQNWFWGFKFGDVPFIDYSDSGENRYRGWQWWDDDNQQWMLHWDEPEPELNCIDCTACNSVSGDWSGDYLGGPAVNGSLGANTIPVIPIRSDDASSSLWMSTMAGAALGSVCIVATVIVIMVKRSTKKTKPAASDHDAVHHVTEFSSTEIVAPTITVLPDERECADEVHGDINEAVEVTEASAPKETEAVSAKE